MSFHNAIKQRNEMIDTYKKMLDNENNQLRIEDIKKQINICEEEIRQLKVGKPLFGKPAKLQQETRIYETNPEKKGEQKITILDPKESTDKENSNVDDKSTKKIGNILRDAIKKKITTNEEEGLKAKVQQVKKTRAKFN